MLRAAAILLLLCGCAEKQLSELDYKERLELANVFIAKCTAAGLTDKSPQWMTCINAEIQAESARRRSAQAARERAGMAMLAGSAAMSQGYYNAAAAARPTMCTSSPGYGGSATIRCY